MVNFCKTKKNIFFPIRAGVEEAIFELGLLGTRAKANEKLYPRLRISPWRQAREEDGDEVEKT